MKIDFNKLTFRQLKQADRIYHKRKRIMVKHVRAGQKHSRKHNGRPSKWSDSNHIQIFNRAKKLLKHKGVYYASKVTGVPRPTLYSYQEHVAAKRKKK